MARLTKRWVNSETAATRVPLAADGSGNADWKRSLTFTVVGGRSTNSTDVYVDNPAGVAMNTVPYVAPFNCYLEAMSAATDGNETWTAEVHVGGALKANATLAIAAADSGYSTSYAAVAVFNAGDKIQLYVNGNLVSKPLIMAIFREA